MEVVSVTVQLPERREELEILLAELEDQRRRTLADERASRSDEAGQRYDFKGTGASVEWSGDELIVIKANAEDRVLAALDVLKEKFVRRDLSLKSMDHGDPKPAGGNTSRLEIKLVAGITPEKGK